jgi:hypothetical protein
MRYGYGLLLLALAAAGLPAGDEPAASAPAAQGAPASAPDLSRGLSARLLVAQGPVKGSSFAATLELTNVSDKPIRIATRCNDWNHVAEGVTTVTMAPDVWKSDRPPARK